MTTACQHWWLLAPAAGPTSKGVCQRCGETREFQNYFEESTPYETWHVRPPKDDVPRIEQTNVVWR